MQRTFTALVQAKFGALDRVLAVLTHRGFIPSGFSATLEADAVTGSPLQRIQVSLCCEDAWLYGKMLASIQKQVYVLSVVDSVPVVSC